MRQSVLALVFIFAASLVQAEVLSWRVDIDGGAGNTSYVTAQLFATTSSGSGYELTGSNIGGPINKNDDATGVWTRDQNLTGLDNTYNFFVKLFAVDGTTVVGWSGLMTWGQLVTDGSLVSGTVPEFPTTTPWNAGTSVVPEPTSVGLLALGMSALLLRRRRRV
jgi:hypothetical protein